MPNSVSFAGIMILLTTVLGTAQSANSGAQADSNSGQVQTPAKPPTTPEGTKNSKKVWTNENLSDANGPISVVGDPKNPVKGKTETPADPQYVANARKQLEKLQSDLADTEKQLVALKDFSSGEPSHSAGKQWNKSYNQTPVNEQIRNLEEKKKQTQTKIDALFDEARKKGVEPGQLR
jgi:hypothetical protein